MTQTRPEILAINPYFSDFIIQIQEARYKPNPKHYSKGDKVILGDDEKATKLTKQLAFQLNTQNVDYFNFHKDENPFGPARDITYSNIKFFISSKSDKETYLQDLGDFLEQLRLTFKQEHLIILGDWNSEWLSQENDYPPVQEAMTYLNQFIDDEFDGGFLLKEAELKAFIPHFFWLLRCNADLPHFYMSFPESKMVLTLCKNGVFHIEFCDETEEVIATGLLDDMGFECVTECSDPVFFDEFEGRRILV